VQPKCSGIRPSQTALQHEGCSSHAKACLASIIPKATIGSVAPCILGRPLFTPDDAEYLTKSMPRAMLVQILLDTLTALMLHITSRPFVAVTTPEHLSNMPRLDPGPLLSALLAILAAGQEVPDHIPPATLAAAAKAAHAVTQQAASAAMSGASIASSSECTAAAGGCSLSRGKQRLQREQQEEKELVLQDMIQPEHLTRSSSTSRTSKDPQAEVDYGDVAAAADGSAVNSSSDEDSSDDNIQPAGRRLSRFDSLKTPRRSILVHSESGLRSSRGTSFKRVVFNPEGDEELLLWSQDSAASAAATTGSSSRRTSTSCDSEALAAGSAVVQAPVAVAEDGRECPDGTGSCSEIREAGEDGVQQQQPPQFRKVASIGRGSFSSDGSPLSPSGREMWPAAAAAFLIAETQQGGEVASEQAGAAGGADEQQQEDAGRQLSRLSFGQAAKDAAEGTAVSGTASAMAMESNASSYSSSMNNSILQRGSAEQGCQQKQQGAAEQLIQVGFDGAAAQAACHQNFPQLLQIAMIFHHTCSWLWSTLEDPAAVAAAAGVEYIPTADWNAAGVGLGTEANLAGTGRSETAVHRVHARSPSPPRRSSTERAAAAADANIRLNTDQLGTFGSTATAMGLDTIFNGLGVSSDRSMVATGKIAGSHTATDALGAQAAREAGEHCGTGQLLWTAEATRKGRYCKPARRPLSTVVKGGVSSAATSGKQHRSNTVQTRLTGLRVLGDTAGSIECILSSWDGSTAGISRTASLAGILRSTAGRSCSGGGGLFASLTGGGQGGEMLLESMDGGSRRRSYLGSLGGLLRNSLSGKTARDSRGGLLEAATIPQLGGNTAGSVVRLRASAAGGRSSAGGGGVELGGWWWGVGPDTGLEPGSRGWQLSRQKLAAEGHLLVAAELTQAIVSALQAQPR
jgi:hypothetical protein